MRSVVLSLSGYHTVISDNIYRIDSTNKIQTVREHKCKQYYLKHWQNKKILKQDFEREYEFPSHALQLMTFTTKPLELIKALDFVHRTSRNKEKTNK